MGQGYPQLAGPKILVVRWSQVLRWCPASSHQSCWHIGRSRGGIFLCFFFFVAFLEGLNSLLVWLWCSMLYTYIFHIIASTCYTHIFHFVPCQVSSFRADVAKGLATFAPVWFVRSTTCTTTWEAGATSNKPLGNWCGYLSTKLAKFQIIRTSTRTQRLWQVGNGKRFLHRWQVMRVCNEPTMAALASLWRDMSCFFCVLLESGRHGWCG